MIGSKSNNRLLFVYGSLKRGFSHHRLLGSSRIISVCSTSPVYRLYLFGKFPAMVRDEAKGVSITGEVYLVDSKTLRRIDIFEEVPDVYKREIVHIDSINRVVETYIYQASIERLLECGSLWNGSINSLNYSLDL